MSDTFTATPQFGAQSAPPAPAKAGPVVEFKPPAALNLRPSPPKPAVAPVEAKEAPKPPAEPPKPPPDDGKADAKPFACAPSGYPLDERNQKTSWGAALSETFDLAKEDSADDLLLNEVIWKSVRGAESAMPMPRRAAFVRVLGDGD